jgi:nucleotidyltransferase/DNA polymerase involved in DNA repair
VERLLALWVEPLSEERSDGSTLRDYLRVLDVLGALCPFVEPVRLGLCTLPLRGPSRFFGGDEAVFAAVRQSVRDVLGREVSLGVAEGLFCAELAARQETVVPSGETTAFRRRQPLAALGHKELTTTGRRLGLHTVGDFADLDAARVAERFSAVVRVLQRVARGELAELPGQRDTRLAARLRSARGDDVVGDEQVSFFGQRSAGDDRAQAAAHRVRHRLGPEGVLVARLRGGRAPEDRATLTPWGSPSRDRRDDAPWPGRLAGPSPITSLHQPVAVELRDDDDQSVRMGARGSLSAAPTSLVLVRGSRRGIVWFAGPWPLVERWWVSSRRRAHLQVLLESGEAMLLSAEAGRWWLVGIYD